MSSPAADINAPRELYITTDDAGDIACFLDCSPSDGAPDHTIVCPVPHAMSAVAKFLATLDLTRCETLTLRWLDLDLIDDHAGFLPPVIDAMTRDLIDKGRALTRLNILECDRVEHIIGLLGLHTFPALACLDFTGSGPPLRPLLAAFESRLDKCSPLCHLFIDHFTLDTWPRLRMYYLLEAHVGTIKLVQDDEDA